MYEWAWAYELIGERGIYLLESVLNILLLFDQWNVANSDKVRTIILNIFKSMSYSSNVELLLW